MFNRLLFVVTVFAIMIFNVIYARELSICTIFRDDANYLPEWIHFHHNRGVDHFYLYNNLSNDNPEKILEKYIDLGWVTLIDWPYEQESHSDWTRIQCEAYMHCVRHHRKDKWIAFIDTDEFLFSPIMRDLKIMLNHYDIFPGVYVHWVVYGTSCIEKLDPSKKMIDQLVYRARFDSPTNLVVKTIARPKYIKACHNPHVFEYKNDILAVDENGKKIKGAETHNVTAHLLRINHYWSRDLEFFYTTKIMRQLKWDVPYESIIKAEAQMNEIYDPILSSTRNSERHIHCD